MNRHPSIKQIRELVRCSSAIIIKALSALIFFFIPVCLSAEFIFIKDGSIIEGRIISETSDTITVSGSGDGARKTIARADILRINYTQMFLGSQFIHRTSGKVDEVYIVDEDQESYTIRRQLNSTKEETVKRDDVLFVTRRNPSGLKAEAEAESISLTWRPPYNKVKNFNIYLRLESSEYKKAAESKDPSFILKPAQGIKSNTLYYTTVRSVELDGSESAASNEVKVTTKNLKPAAPDGLRYETLKSEGSDIKMRLKWKPSTDADGSVKGYRVFRELPSGYQKIGETPDLSMEVTDSASSFSRFTVRAVDDYDDESLNSGWTAYEPFLYGGFELRYIIPTGTFSTMFEQPGLGAEAVLWFRGVGLSFLNAGFKAGWRSLPGTGQDEDKRYKSSTMVPLTAMTEGAWGFSEKVLFSLRIGGGVSYNTVTYYADEDALKNDRYTADSLLQPRISAGVYALYRATPRLIVELGADYSAIIEKSGMPAAIDISLGCRWGIF